MKYDFTGWATKNDIKCSDGRIINKDAFKHNDGHTVPLVWNHQHDDSNNILGHALLENRDNGVYAYCKFNNTDAGQNAKTLVEHGDITSLSIYANKLKQQGNAVMHGTIREVSLVLAGANPGAFIDSVMKHSDASDFDGVIYTGESLEHCEKEEESKEEESKEESKDESKDEESKEEISHADGDKEETIGDIFDTLSDKQKDVVYTMIGSILDKENTKENDGD